MIATGSIALWIVYLLALVPGFVNVFGNPGLAALICGILALPALTRIDRRIADGANPGAEAGTNPDADQDAAPAPADLIAQSGSPRP